WLVRRPAAGTRRRQALPGARRHAQLRVENLEDRRTPTTTINVLPTTADLIAQIRTADHTQGPVVLNLPANTDYVLTAPDTSNLYPEDNNWYGPNGLPAIDNDITIEGNGATIERDPNAPPFRLFYVSGGLAGELTPPGSLTLKNLTLEGGKAEG